ncbi:MAG: gamma-glutamylcyclotransferase [Alphaproteobacteria bacterium]|nr:gamma-glutamylcyclotransferase [Alphaproteobacteria bacterium]
MTAGSSDKPAPLIFPRTADGLLVRESFTPERIAQWQAEAARLNDGMPFLSHEEREASRASHFADHPPGKDVWVFGYGSLMWNPAIHVEESRMATLQGYSRSFCLLLKMGRGSPENPGLMLAIDEGGACTGIAHRIASERVESETNILWMREMLSGAYIPRWVELEVEGERQRAFTFIINRAHPRYTGHLPIEQVARQIAHAEGVLGKNSDYLFRTMGELERLGVHDAPIAEIHARVRALTADQQAAQEGN